MACSGSLPPPGRLSLVLLLCGRTCALLFALSLCALCYAPVVCFAMLTSSSFLGLALQLHILLIVLSSRVGGRSIPFSLKQEYRLSDHLDLSDTQSLFTISSPDTTRNSPPLEASSTSIVLSARPTALWRPRDPDLVQHARLRSLRMQQSEPVEWERVTVWGPDIEDKHTLGQLARMTANAYALPGQSNWYDLDMTWNTVRSSHSASL